MSWGGGGGAGERGYIKGTLRRDRWDRTVLVIYWGSEIIILGAQGRGGVIFLGHIGRGWGGYGQKVIKRNVSAYWRGGVRPRPLPITPTFSTSSLFL